ncbi:hypothetical protein ACSLST_21155, partial [Klebsiella pneumoniae]|uniref:hypothetical protein n=1 Tax=Klebsiella pneumoniae TaxID=573 RepID=UPI003EE04AB2
HVRVGNCQASNKAESPVERLGLLLLCYRLPMSFFAAQGKSNWHRYEHCAATAPERGTGRSPSLLTIRVKARSSTGPLVFVATEP